MTTRGDACVSGVVEKTNKQMEMLSLETSQFFSKSQCRGLHGRHGKVLGNLTSVPSPCAWCPMGTCLGLSIYFRRDFTDITFHLVGINDWTSRSGSLWLTFLGGQQR